MKRPEAEFHGLIPSDRQFDDCQPSRRKANASLRVDPDATLVRTAVDNCVRHSRKLLPARILVDATTAIKASKSAHQPAAFPTFSRSCE